jgi:4-amino-4-deoxy-L-arabinose transferase-like glycosyltransferase
MFLVAKQFLQSKNSTLLALVVVLVVFNVLKIYDLLIPYYWDEAWSYVPAIKEMYRQGPSLLPNSIDPELYRGHPLLFYFLSASWMKIFGTSVLASKLLPLLFSNLLIIYTYLIVKRAFASQAAITTVVLLSVQAIFFVQASFLLPEVLLALCITASFYYYFNRKLVMSAFFLSCALFTKETAVVALISLFIAELFYLLILDRVNISLAKVLKSMAFLLVPTILIFSFFWYQKKLLGWYFFPSHMGFIDINKASEMLQNIFNIVFNAMGRIGISIITLISILVILVKRKKIDTIQAFILSVLLLFIVGLMAFSSINFFTTRYLIAALPALAIISVSLTYVAFNKKIVLFISLSGIAIVLSLNATLSKRNNSDITLGYRDMVVMHQEMVRYCERQELFDKYIATHFLMAYNLGNADVGYLNGRKFDNIMYSVNNKTQYAIRSAIEQNHAFNNEIKNRNATLMKRFEKGKAWCEIYALPSGNPH